MDRIKARQRVDHRAPLYDIDETYPTKELNGSSSESSGETFSTFFWTGLSATLFALSLVLLLQNQRHLGMVTREPVSLTE